MTEKELQKIVLDYLKFRGVFHWRNNTGRRGGVAYGQKGSPDICCVLPDGTFWGIEVKGDGGKLSHDQIDWIQSLNRETKAGVSLFFPFTSWKAYIDERIKGYQE
jgi:hypothetical protein